MGCGESKIKRINLSPENNGRDDVKVEIVDIVSNKVMNESSPSSVCANDESTILPNRLLAAVPVSDLGDSLDSRHLSESLNISQNLGGGLKKHQHSNSLEDSADSGDSGYDEYDEEYSHIITENSSASLVSKVEANFKPAELPELLVITGRACARILSGYQKNKQEESKILDALREEGLLAKPKGKTAGGMSFEVVDANVAAAKMHKLGGSNDENVGNGDVFVSASFIPQRTLKRLESRRTVRASPIT